ncbi:ABC transporter permease [Nannocystis bainbridge]|uniref:ABC transporter permease n=1 Tax=Nannocystis bainbridge TaxID=2995303 RepID=A0ABT5DTV9_9BACT|nr:ABC transporter permease [Nannocystis bainbridge]MDC0717034.1 ABC transporter permease [Nannocystis bainbridge]
MSARPASIPWPAVLRRLVVAVASLALVAVLVFLTFEWLADPAALRLGRGASPEARESLRVAMGLDRSFGTRLLEHVARAITFDFGASQARGAPAGPLMLQALGPTLAYALPGWLLGTAAAVNGGLAAARRRAVDRALSGLSTAVLSTSSVIVVVLAQHVLAHRLGWFPVLGWPLAGADKSPLAYVMLPALVWALLQWGPDVRHYRAVFERELAAPHLDGLRARGVPERRIAGHVLRAAVGPVVARIGQRISHVVVGSVVIEELFNIPGLGALLVAAIHEADAALVQAIAVATAAVTIAGQALCDAVVWWIDPRVRRRDVN